MSISEKLTTIAENQQKVFDAGWKVFHKAFTGNNTRTRYAGAFTQSDFSGLKFDPPIKPNTGETVFQNYNGEELPCGVDFSNIVSSSTSAQFTFRYAEKLKRVPDLNWCVQQRYGGTWQGCTKLEEIAVVRCNENTEFSATFLGCSDLMYVAFEGVIGQNIGFSSSPKLDHDYIVNMFENNLKNYSQDTSGTQWTVTLGSVNLNKLSDAEKAIATEKGWTLAS